jgi:hypothetical protein
MPKRTKQTKHRYRHKRRTINNKTKRSKRYKISGGYEGSVSCEKSGSIDHNPPKWNSRLMGGDDMIDNDLYNHYTDGHRYAISN